MATFITILVSLGLVFLLAVAGLMSVVILMQKPSANAGMGAALGGGAAESVFGGEASSKLLKFTVGMSVAFFLGSFLLYMLVIWNERPAASTGVSLPSLGAPASTSTPAATAKPTAPAATTAAPATSATAATPAPATAPKATSAAASGSAK